MNAWNAGCALISIALLASCDSNSGRWVWEGRPTQVQAQPRVAARPDADPASSRNPVAPTEAAPPADPGKLVPFAIPEGAAGPASPSDCAIPGLALPADAKIYAAGAYSGRKLDYQIDQSGHEATQIDVAVNDETAPVVLMLGAYEPTVWNIGWSTRTRIVGVLVSGYHRQVIAGLPAAVPRLNSSYDNKGPCGYFYLGQDQLERVNPLARRMFGQPVTRAYIAKNGFVTVGNGTGTGFVTDSSQAPDQFRDRSAPLAGEAGLRDAVAKGWLREARSGDMTAWKSAYDAANQRDVPPLSGGTQTNASDGYPLHNAYVVQKAMRIPAGLYGAHAATFIVPRGVARPEGNPGHSQILDYNTMTCGGLTCRRD